MVATNDPEHPAPDESVINAVRDHILPLAPVAGSGLYVFGATEKVIPMTIALSKDTPQIRAAIKSELNALMFRDGVPEGRMYLSRISEAISLSAGEVAHRLIDPSSDIDLGETELPVLGEITWQAYDPVRSK